MAASTEFLGGYDNGFRTSRHRRQWVHENPAAPFAPVTTEGMQVMIR